MKDLRGADFSGQDLAGQDFTDTDLTHADFRGAKLAGAVWTGARLTGVKWDGADFNGANLSDSLIREIRMHVLQWRVAIKRNGNVKVGRCQDRTPESWLSMGAQDIADLTPDEDAPENFLAERDSVLAASMALRGLY